MKIIKIPPTDDMKVEAVEQCGNGKLVNTRILKKEERMSKKLSLNNKNYMIHPEKFYGYMEQIWKTATEHGWHEQPRSTGHYLGLVMTEMAEAVEADRNSVTHYECVPEWEDLVRNGYARRSGAVGQSIFYSVTHKGFEAIARRNGIRIRYEIEVNP